MEIKIGDIVIGKDPEKYTVTNDQCILEVIECNFNKLGGKVLFHKLRPNEVEV